MVMRNVLFRHLPPWEQGRAKARSPGASDFPRVFRGFRD
jgi:hypothetical protein